MFTRLLPAVLPPLGREMDSIFRDLLSDLPQFRIAEGCGAHCPPINVLEGNDAYLVELELPGLKRENLDVKVENNTLTVQGILKDPETPGAAEWHRKERLTGDFHREISFPASIDPARVAANLADGVLSIQLPKSAAALARKIEVVEQRALPNSDSTN